VFFQLYHLVDLAESRWISATLWSSAASKRSLPDSIGFCCCYVMWMKFFSGLWLE